MTGKKLPEGIYFNILRINSLSYGSGIFAGKNIQYEWRSHSTKQSGFGNLTGDGNRLDSHCNTVTDPNSSSGLQECFDKLLKARIGRWDS